MVHLTCICCGGEVVRYAYPSAHRQWWRRITCGYPVTRVLRLHDDWQPSRKEPRA